NNEDEEAIITGPIKKEEAKPKKKWWEANLEKKEVRLDRMRKEIDRISAGLENSNEKNKLMLEKKKLDMRLLEIDHENYKIFCNNKSTVKKTAQEIEDEKLFGDIHLVKVY